MLDDAQKTVLALRRAFESAKTLDRITQEPFDSTPQHLHRLARIRPGERAESRDLWEYTQDLLYGKEIQGSLLAHVLPFCLEAWREDLRGLRSGYGGFVEYLYPVLANCGVFDLHLNSTQSAAVADFIQHTILEEIDDQRGLSYKGKDARPYGWIGAITTYGVLLPDIEHIWRSWWSVDTIGKAVAALQYVSCLMYPTNENPVFAPWTPEAGGGPACLWEFEGHLYNHCWMEPNIVFLKEILTPQQASDVIDKSVEMLAKEPEHGTATEIQEDIPLCIGTLEARCSELPRILGTSNESSPLEWAV
jgi:hypothetical protein